MFILWPQATWYADADSWKHIYLRRIGLLKKAVGWEWEDVESFSAQPLIGYAELGESWLFWPLGSLP